MSNPLNGILLNTRIRNHIIIIAVYRFATLIIEGILSILLVPITYFQINPFVLFGLAVIEGLVMSLLPFFLTRQKNNNTVLSMLVGDIIICIFLVMFSGALNSPFILYSISPVLTAALVMDKKTTAALAGITGIAVIFSHIVNPYYFFVLDSRSLTNLSIYFTAICLAAILPFVVNANLRQNLEHEHIIKERRRLSREIHDGVAQTLLALSWQAQQVRSRLKQTNSDGEDIQQMEKLAEKARHDIVESLEILRNYESQGNFVTLLREQLQNLKQDSKINFTLDVPNIDLRLNGNVELEIMHVFQEALMNIKKHSEARSVHVKLKRENGKLELNIGDDGRGFDSVTYYKNGSKIEGHFGLSVMQERINSINGQISVLSAPGKGTRIKIEVPCKFAEVDYGN